MESMPVPTVDNPDAMRFAYDAPVLRVIVDNGVMHQYTDGDPAWIILAAIYGESAAYRYYQYFEWVILGGMTTPERWELSAGMVIQFMFDWVAMPIYEFKRKVR
jgi:hypothetical protein